MTCEAYIGQWRPLNGRLESGEYVWTRERLRNLVLVRIFYLYICANMKESNDLKENFVVGHVALCGTASWALKVVLARE